MLPRGKLPRHNFAGWKRPPRRPKDRKTHRPQQPPAGPPKRSLAAGPSPPAAPPLRPPGPSGRGRGAGVLTSLEESAARWRRPGRLRCSAASYAAAAPSQAAGATCTARGTSGGCARPWPGWARSPEHGRAVAAFWRKNRADPKLKADFLLSAADYRRFQESLCKALDVYEEKEDVAIQEVAAHIRNIEQKRREMVQAILEPQRADTLGDGSTAVNTFTGNLSDSPFAMEEQEQPGSSWNTFLQENPSCASRTVPELQYPETGQPLTFIGHQETGREGNVHTGAKPPWLMNEEEEGERQIGPSYEEFLKEKQKQKLKQLPPNRVGANFDHSCQTGDGWLPSFGRVWNHGRRWQSRHQFKAESGNKQPESKRKRPLTS